MAEWRSDLDGLRLVGEDDDERRRRLGPLLSTIDPPRLYRMDGPAGSSAWGPVSDFVRRAADLESEARLIRRAVAAFEAAEVERGQPK